MSHRLRRDAPRRYYRARQRPVEAPAPLTVEDGRERPEPASANVGEGVTEGGLWDTLQAG